MNKRILLVCFAAAVVFICLSSSCKRSEKQINWAIQNTGERICGVEGVVGVDIDMKGLTLRWQDKATLIAIVDSDAPFSSVAALKGIVKKQNNERYVEDKAHSIAVASIISTNDESTYQSVLKGAPLLSIQIDASNCDIDRMIADLKDAEGKGIKVVNMSFSLHDYSQKLYDYMKQSSMLFVCAAGNGADNDLCYPAKFECENVISVVGMNNYGCCSSSSNRSYDADIAAPGENVLCLNEKSETVYMTGTSFAAPYVTACCAYLISETGCDAKMAKEIVCSCANKYPSLNKCVKEGRVLSIGNVIEYIQNEMSAKTS